jgi:TatD DNase family protein
MIDSHCHLDFDTFDNRREQLLDDARGVGVQLVIDIGVDLESSVRAVALAEQFEMVYAAVGVHPHDSKSVDERVLAELRRLAANPKVVAIGEIGLDYYRNLSPHDIQRQAFRQQLELASDRALPVVIHTREAFDETVAIVREYAPKLVGGVFHCFPGNSEDARRVIDMGFCISVGGVITFPDSRMSHLAVEAPLEKMILETDSPYLTPQPFRGQQNQPAYVGYVYRKLAELKGLPLSEVETTVDRTCRKLFRLVETFGG